jgi:FkbH-like protein
VEKILRAWNVGADSVVFVDDSAMELDEVRMAFPSMTCLQFSKKPAAAMALFEQIRDLFGKPAVETEDALRQASIRAGGVFQESARAAGAGEFLRGLAGRVVFDPRKNPANQRLLELVNKTNQFNLNGLRISEGEWMRHLAETENFAVGVSYEDKFGPLGAIGVVAGTRNGGRLDISTWVMSCRAFSRRIEFHVLDYLFQAFGAETLAFDFRATERNQPLQEFLRAIRVEDGVLSREAFLAAGHELPHRAGAIED